MTHNGPVTGFEYDDEANLTRLLPPVGGKTDYEYNDGRLYKVKHEANPDDWREYTYEYDDAGRLLRIDYPGGMQALRFIPGALVNAGSDQVQWGAEPLRLC